MNWKSIRNAGWGLMVLVLSSSPVAKACAWSEDWEGAFYRFFEPEYGSVEEFKPFHFTFERLYNYDMMGEDVSEAANMNAWTAYLGPMIPADHIRQLVYGSSLDQLEYLRKDIVGGKSIPPAYAQNLLVKEWKANQRRELLDYIILAHLAEPLCVFGYDPWSEEERPMEGADELIAAAKAGSKNASSPFLKLRYGYQALRLEQYSGHFAEAIATYQEYVLPHAAADRLIASWSQSHYAGCLRAQELEAEAAYHFSRVFDECPSRRIQAWYGWRILSDEIWESVQAKCKNNHEMAVVYFLRAFSPNAVSVDDMRKMHDLDPGSTLLDVLLLREINKLENSILGYPYGGESAVHKRLSKDAASELLDLVSVVLKSGKMHDRNIWELAQIYLQFLSGDTTTAHANLTAKQPQLTGDGALKGKLMDLVFRIGSAKSVDRSVENAIFKDFTNLSTKITAEESEELARFRDDAFAWLYDAQGEPAKALLARNRSYDLYNYPIDLDLVNDMIAFEAKDDKTLYEKELLGRLNGNDDPKDMLLDIKGTGLLGRNLIPEAIKVFEQISESFHTSAAFQLNGDPFRSVVTDVVNCEDCGAGAYNKLTYAQAVLKLQKQVLTDPAKAVEYNMLLGNAYYNTSYFGPAWNAKDYYRSGSSWYSLGERSDYYTFNVETFDEAVDMRLAQDYYAKALAGAKDKEMAALAAFMVAKCELNQSYIDGAENMDKYHSGFAALKGTYRKTDVYKDLIKECWYLSAYVGK